MSKWGLFIASLCMMVIALHGDVSASSKPLLPLSSSRNPLTINYSSKQKAVRWAEVVIEQLGEDNEPLARTVLHAYATLSFDPTVVQKGGWPLTLRLRSLTSWRERPSSSSSSGWTRDWEFTTVCNPIKEPKRYWDLCLFDRLMSTPVAINPSSSKLEFSAYRPSLCDSSLSPLDRELIELALHSCVRPSEFAYYQRDVANFTRSIFENTLSHGMGTTFAEMTIDERGHANKDNTSLGTLDIVAPDLHCSGRFITVFSDQSLENSVPISVLTKGEVCWASNAGLDVVIHEQSLLMGPVQEIVPLGTIPSRSRITLHVRTYPPIRQ